MRLPDVPDTGGPAGFQDPIDVAFTAAVDGTTQRHVEMLPVGFDREGVHHLAIALHGHGSDRWQYVLDPRDECRGARDVAATYGMVFVSPDYRATTSWMGPEAEADVLQIIDELRRHYAIGKVFVVGGSMGGSSALTFAALHPESVDGVSSQNGMANYLLYDGFTEFISASFGGAREQIPLEYKKRSAEFWPEKFTMPVAITLGALDDSVPPDSALRLARMLENMGRRILLINRQDMGHATSYEDTVTAFEFVVTAALGIDRQAG